ASGGSFRVRDEQLVKAGAPWARLDGFFGASNRTLKIAAGQEGLAKEFILAGKAYKRLALERTVPVVLFEPNDLQLVGRGPSTRREYFDSILRRTQPGYRTLARSYERALAQRNALLKQPPANAKKQIFAWNVRLSQLGAQVAAARSALIDS